MNGKLISPTYSNPPYSINNIFQSHKRNLTPPQHHRKSNKHMEYMSQEGYDKLSAELNELIKVRLPEVIESISEARDKGDLSENFEYRAAKREQGRLLGRIRFMQNVLAHARVMPSTNLTAGSVQLLTKVELLNLATNKRMAYTIVSPHEANAAHGKISVKSPVAKAILNKRAGEIVEVQVPIGTIKLRIESISL